MTYDQYGNPVEDFAVQAAPAAPDFAAYAAANPDLQAEAARVIGTGEFASDADYYAWQRQKFGDEGRGQLPSLAVRATSGVPAANPVQSLAVYDPSQGQQYDEYGSPVASSPSQASQSFAVPENYGNPKNKIYQLSAAPDEKVRLVGLDGTVYYEGAGTEGAAKAADIVQQLGKQFNTGATWILQKQTPGSTGWQQVSQDTVGKQKTTALNSFLNVALPIAGSFIPGVGPVLGAAIGSGLNSALQTKPLGTALKDAALSAAGSYVGGKLIGPGGAFTGGSDTGRLVGDAGADLLGAGVSAGAGQALGNTLVQEVLVQGVKQTLPAIVAQQLIGQGLAQAVGGVFDAGGSAPKSGAVEAVTVTAPKGGVADPLLPGLPAAVSAISPTDPGTLTNTPADLAHLGDNLTTGPIDKVKAYIAGLTPLQKAALGLKVAAAGLTVGGALGGSGAGGGGAPGSVKSIADQQAGLPDIFRAKLGAPRGMFSALSTKGTAYTPRTISNILPEQTGGASGVNPSGTAALSDYLRRYPDVAAEATKNPGAYGDVNEDGTINDDDFALMHYILHGKDEGRTLAVKTGGYIENPSRDTDMNSRFQVMRKAEGGVVVDPLALARSYHADTPAPESVFVPRPDYAVQPPAIASAPATQSVSPYAVQAPSAMSDAYHYGERPTGEAQHFNYALAEGATAPWMTEGAGTGVYNMFGVRTNTGVGSGGGTPAPTPVTPVTPVTTPSTSTGTAPSLGGPTGNGYNNSTPDLQSAMQALGMLSDPTGVSYNNTGLADLLLTQFRDGTMTPGSDIYNKLVAMYGGKDDTPNDGGAPTTGYGSNVSNQSQEWMDARQAYWDALNGATSAAESTSALERWNAAQGLKKGGPAGGHGHNSPRSQFAVQGPGTGRSDSIPAVLSDGEYVMDAETVALLGDGSSKAGAKKLDVMRSNLRKHKGRSLAQGRFSVNAKAPEKYLSGGRS